MAEGSYLVVGGSGGIGLEVVKKLRDGGNQVIAAARRPGALETEGGVDYRPLDVTAEKLDFGDLPNALDGLVYCPGTIRLRPFRRLGRDELMADLEVNYLGAVKAIQATATSLRKAAAGGSVVLFSTVAVRTGMPFHASIAGAKGAVEGLTRSLAAEFAPHIRFNAIAPSLTDTPLAGDLLASPEKKAAAAGRHPLKRVGTPQEIAGMAVYLLMPESRWITGQVLSVDGGMSALRTFR